MGMSAGQARLLSITSRLTDNELKSQMITNSKLRLAQKSSEASQEYMDALNTQQLMYTTYDDNGSQTYIALTANTMMTYSDLKNQYNIIDSSGKLIVSSQDAKNFESSDNLSEFLQKYGIEVVDTNENYNNQMLAYQNYLTELDDYNRAYQSQYQTWSDQSKAYEQYLRDDANYQSDKGAYDAEYAEYQKAHDRYNALLGTTDFADKYNTIVGMQGTSGISCDTAASGGDSKAFEAILAYFLGLGTDGYGTQQGTATNNSATFTTTAGEIFTYTFDKTNNYIYEYLNTQADTYADTTTETENAVDYATRLATAAAQHYVGTTCTYDTLIDEAKMRLRDQLGLDPELAENADRLRLELLTLQNNWNSAYSQEYTTRYNEKYKELYNKKYNELNLFYSGGITDEITTYQYLYLDDGDDLVGTGNEGIQNELLRNDVYGRTNGNKEIDLYDNVLNDEDEYEKKSLYQRAIDLLYLLQTGSSLSSTEIAGETGVYANFKKDMEKLVPNEPEWDKNPPTAPTPVTPPGTFACTVTCPDPVDKPTGSPSEIAVNDKAKAQWYINLWYAMNGSETANKLQSASFTYIEMDTSDPNNPTIVENGETKTYSYGTPNDTKNESKANYKVIEDNLLNSSEWLQFALESGVVSLKQATYYNPSEDSKKVSELTSEGITWDSIIYTSATDIVSQDNETAIAIAEVKYKNALTEIENKDNKYDQDLKNLDTEHSALQTEYDSIKETISKNVERSFKAFS